MSHHPIKILYAKILSGIAIIAVVFGAGLYIGFDSGSHRAVAEERVNLSAFWKVWDVLNERFVPGTSTKAVSDEEKINGAIKGLVESVGDPYTVYFPPQELSAFEENIQGNFEGVGMEVGLKDDVLTVIAPLKGSPAEKAGVQAGDKVLAINGTTTEGMSVDKAIKLIRGKAGTEVTITFRSSDKEKAKDITIVRDVIKIPAVETELRKDKIFVIRISSFTATAATEFKDALREFVNSKSDKLIIDLRNNPGGYLDAAVDMASWFLPQGKVVVSEDFGTNSSEEAKVLRSRGYDIFSSKLKTVILINGGSASASEILAGALKEHGKATLVGETTFGKGSVQELVPITKDTSLKVTIARWLTPNGNSISLRGIDPDVKVELTEDNIKDKKDAQLDKAVEILLKK
ncbi:MAG: carboxy-terminal-processing protease, carboxyl-terminal processing protease [Candidatus Parcubacteria bacterium]|jgi:carboxyl-terminal processing protease